LAGANRDLVCNALVVTNRAIRKWINAFNRCGVDGLIVKKRPGRMTIINDQQALQLTNLIDQPQQAQRAFWTAKAFHGYISKEYQIQCSYEAVVRFFHKQGYALKTPQPWPDKQDEQLRETFLQQLKQLMDQPHVDIWFADESGFEGDPRPRKRWDKKGSKK
jgi:transposase